MDYLGWFPERIAELRTQRGVSARDMSLSLGQSESYINKIENRRTLPSMAGFFYICEYLGISLSEFFNDEMTNPVKIAELLNSFQNLNDDLLNHFISIANAISQNIDKKEDSQ